LPFCCSKASIPDNDDDDFDFDVDAILFWKKKSFECFIYFVVLLFCGFVLALPCLVFCCCCSLFVYMHMLLKCVVW
jgi:hypothetical protein